MQHLATSFKQLEGHPEIGRPDNDAPELRELIIEFGTSGCVHCIAISHLKMLFIFWHLGIRKS